MSAQTRKRYTYEEAPKNVAAPIKIVIAVACFGIALLLLYLTFAAPQEGTQMRAIQTIMRGVGGSVCFLVPMILIWIGTLTVFSAKGKKIRVLNVIANTILFLCLFGAVEVFFVDAIREWGKQTGGFLDFLGYADFISKAYRYGGGGGALGAVLGYPAARYLSSLGGFFALLVVMAVCLTVTGSAQKIVRGAKEKSEAHRERVEERRSEREEERMFEKYERLDGDFGDEPRSRGTVIGNEPRGRGTDMRKREAEARRRMEKRAQERPMRRVSDPDRKSMYIGNEPPTRRPSKKRNTESEDDNVIHVPPKKALPNSSANRKPSKGWSDESGNRRPSKGRSEESENRRPSKGWSEETENRRPSKDWSEESENRRTSKGRSEESENRRPSKTWSEESENRRPLKGRSEESENRRPSKTWSEESENRRPSKTWSEETENRRPMRTEPEAKAEEPVFDVEEEIPKPLRRKKEAAKAEDPFAVEPEKAEDAEEFAPRNYAETKPKPQRVTEGVRALDLDDEPPFDVPKKAVRPMKNAEPEEEPEDEAYNYPPIDLLAAGEAQKMTAAHRDGDQRKADKLMDTLESFGIETRLIGIAHGPAVTRFELQPAPGVKVSRITALSDDIALNLAAESVRIEAPIPGKAAVGVEIPNDKIEMVRLRDVLESPEAKRNTSKIAVGLGKDNSGRYVIADIAKMPHVLIAGQTGSGKSVCINSIIASILYRAEPKDVRMILIDPKVVELSIYNDIPHLIAPVVTDPKKAASALQWAVMEMTNRYKRFAEKGVRDIKGYNKALKKGEERMPQFVIVIDELADLMMVAPGEVEDSICRLAQLARAAGMHLVIATQRPSVNVITGIIKANIPTRIAFSVASQVDSRTMIDHGGAEKLLGNGDMLFLPNGSNKAIRAQGSWISDEEVHAIVSYIKARSETTYDEDVMEKIENAVKTDAEKEEAESEYDSRLPEAVEIVVEAGQASVSMLQRRMRVGYARAGRLIDEMERRGIVSVADGAKPRDVLITREQMNEMFEG